MITILRVISRQKFETISFGLRYETLKIQFKFISLPVLSEEKNAQDFVNDGNGNLSVLRHFKLKCNQF